MRWNFDRRRGRVETVFFDGGRTNVAYNCLDRHVAAGRGRDTCFLWEVQFLEFAFLGVLSEE